VMVLVRSDLDFNLISINSDDEGRSIVMEADVQGSPYLFVNIYAPNKTQDQCRFFDKLNNNIEDCVANKELKILLGGDFNVTLDSDLDCSGGRPFTKDSVKNVQNLCFDFDLVDIWRIRNPDRRRFTWRQKSPFIQRRLDYWLISDEQTILIKTAASEIVYKELRNRTITPLTAQLKFNTKFVDDVLEWKEIYSLPFRVTLDTNSREFQHKLLNRCLVTNAFFVQLQHVLFVEIWTNLSSTLLHLVITLKIFGLKW